MTDINTMRTTAEQLKVMGEYYATGSGKTELIAAGFFGLPFGLENLLVDYADLEQRVKELKNLVETVKRDASWETVQRVNKFLDEIHFPTTPESSFAIDSFEVLTRRLRQRTELEEWLPIETAPRDRTYFLACGLPKNFWPPISVKYHKGEDSWTDKDGMLYPLNAFTSWMSLPAPPKVEKEAGL